MNVRRHIVTSTLWLTSLLLLSPTSFAESGVITLDQVVINVLERHPQLQINDYEARVAAERIKKARQGTQYKVNLGLANFAGTGVNTGVDNLESNLSLTKILELGNKAHARGVLAEAQAQLLKNEQDGRRLDLLARATERFIHVLIDQHRQRIAERQLNILRRTLEVVNKRIAAGKAHIAERRRINIEIGRAEIEAEHAEHELATSRLKLAASWGAGQVDFSRAEADLFDLPPLQSFTQLKTLLEENPDLARYATQKRVAAAQLRLAQSQSKPDIEISGGLRHLNEPGDFGLLFSATLPLGASSRAKPQIEANRWLKEREPLRYQQQALDLYVTLFETYQELVHARTAFDMLNERIVPESEQAESDYRKGYQAGRFSLLELSEAQRVLLENRLEKVMVAANYHRFAIEIERLTGMSMLTGDAQ
jgi:cobalt-zinc-cadmium efflux system outer membrane protein